MLSLIVLGLLGSLPSTPATAQEDRGIVTAPKPKSLFGIQARAEEPAEVKTSKPASAPICPGDVPFFPTGFTFPALLPDAVYSYNMAAPVMALIEDDIRFRDRVVLAKGTRLVGSAGLAHTFDRVNINWTLAVSPEGCEFPFAGLAMSAEDGSAGIKGRLEKHEDSVAATIAIKSLITGAQAAATVAAPIEGAATSGLSSEANQMLDQNVAKVKSLDSIYIHERTQIKVFVLRRFIRATEAH